MLTIFGCWVTWARGEAGRWLARSCWARGEAGRWLARSWWARADGRPSTSAWFSAAGWWAIAIKWAAPSQAETSRAEPATVATATRADFLRARGAELRWAAAPGRAGADCGDFRCRACAWDTIDLRSGAGNALSHHPGAGPAVPSPAACGS